MDMDKNAVTAHLGLGVEYKRQMLAIEKNLSEIADSSSIINNLLSRLLFFYNADRAYVIEFDGNLMVGTVTYEVYSQEQTDLLNIQYPQESTFSRWIQQIYSNQPMIIPDVEAIKDDSPAEYESLKKQNISSQLAIPFSKKYTIGFVGIDNPRRFVTNSSFAFMVSYAIVAELNEIKLQASTERLRKQLTTHQETDLYVSFFGGLTICGAHGTLHGDQITADQCYQLLVYLLLHRKRIRPLRELADVLWPEAAVADPYRDIKNVVYRLKRFLVDVGLVDLVIGSSGSFIINPKYMIYVDFERFEKAYVEFQTDSSLAVKATAFEMASKLYKGSLLPRIEHLHWVMPRVSYYQGLYLQLLKTIIQCEINEGLYSSAQRHAITGLEIEPYDVDFKVASVVCMYAMSNRSLANSYYLNIEGELTNQQKEYIAAFKYRN